MTSTFTGFDVNHGYDRWLSRNFPRQADLKRMADTWKVFPYQPLISIILPVFNPPEDYLRKAIESVVQQVYPHWELCIADDASTQIQVRQTLEAFTQQDNRIKVIYRAENGHISRCSNTALELATGEFVALLDHDDLLTPDALYEAVLLLNQHPEADMIYSDEDHLDRQNRFSNAVFKPEWCPDTLLSRMYTGHLGVYRRSIVQQVGGFRIGYEGSQDYDLVLRFTEVTDRIFHIPKVLYHWRIHDQSVASSAEAKPYAFLAAQKALADALQRRGEPGNIQQIENYGIYRIRYEIAEYQPVAILLAVQNLERLDRCLRSIVTQSTYPKYEVILVGKPDAKVIDLISQWQTAVPLSFYVDDRDFNLPRLCNVAASQAKADYFLFLDSATEITTADWIEAMVEQAQRPSIGAVGALLFTPDRTIHHAGVIMGVQGITAHSCSGLPETHIGYFGQAVSINNYSALSGACLMCRRETFEQAGGFNEILVAAYSDIDFCLRLGQQDLRNVYLPHVRLCYSNLPSDTSALDRSEDSENQAMTLATEYMQQTWGQVIEHDPCYSPNLTRDRTDYSIREQPEQAQIDAVVPFRQLQVKFKRTQANLDATQQALSDAQSRIAAMETSKFWQLRSAWFQVKRSIGLPPKE